MAIWADFKLAGELRLVAELGVPVLVQCLGVVVNIFSSKFDILSPVGNE